MSVYVASVVALIVLGYTGVRWGVYYACGYDNLPRRQRSEAKTRLSMIGLLVGLGVALGYTAIYLDSLPR